MRTKLTLFLFLFLSFVLQAQNNVVLDSLELQLKSVKNDIDKAKTLNALANQYKYFDPKKMVQYANDALLLSKRIKYHNEEAYAYLNIGVSNIITGDYKLAMDNFILAKSVFEDIQLSNTNAEEVQMGLAKTYGTMGIVFSEQSNYPKALQYYLKSVKLYENLKEEENCAKIYNNIGVVYKAQSTYFKALEYFIKAQKIQERLSDSNIGITFTNIANIYFSQKNNEKAIEYYNLAKASLDKNEDFRALGEWYNNMGLYYEQSGNSNKAIESWKSAIVTFEKVGDRFGLTDTYIYIAQFYLRKEKLHDALQVVNKALVLATEVDVLEQKVLAEKLLSTIYEKQGDVSNALLHLKRYSVAKDSLTNEENIRKAVEAEMNYEFDKKEIIQREENSKKELRLKQESESLKMKLLYGTLIAILLFSVGFLIFNRMQLKKRFTLQKELAEYEQKALHLQMNPHFVFNCLGSISSFIVQNGTDSAIKYLAKFSKLMRLTLEYSKETLIPIDKEIESIRNYLELEQLRFNHKFNFTIHKSDEIEDDVALPPLIIQPFVENAIIHGVIPNKGIGSILLDFSIVNDMLICKVIDDGVGINQSKKNKEGSVIAHKSMALDIIQKRLEMIASTTSKTATLEINERVERNISLGTNVVLTLPLQYAQ
ncbi:tetratricopeptide repeat protein [Flavobacterium chuncheonense]|uniref:Tetratricopeptide repeat protein n=1 Tax=Flavobacterium chuncheonense TaxID=2026653 RepID=A0ABW5YJ15_9FLAO